MKECLLHYTALPLFYSILFLFLPPLLFFSFHLCIYFLSCLLCVFSFFILSYLHSTFHIFSGLTFTSWSFALLPRSPNHLSPLSPLWISFLFTIHTSLPFCFFLIFFHLFFIFFASLPLHLSCGPNSPITAGGNYAWKVIRCSLNNYPLMQLIDFSFQELCFLSPGSAFLSPS